MRNLLLWPILFLICTPAISQDTRISATRIKPLYCYTDILRGYDSSCVHSLRITFNNSVKMRIHNLKFRVTIWDVTESDSLVIYDAKHEASLPMNTGEVFSTDVTLLNPISPPGDEHSFENRKAWKWKVGIISVNRK